MYWEKSLKQYNFTEHKKADHWNMMMWESKPCIFSKLIRGQNEPQIKKNKVKFYADSFGRVVP